MRSCSGHFISAIILTAGLLLSCSGNPTTPPVAPSASQVSIATQTSSNNHFCFGYYALTIGTRDGSIDIVPVRTEMLHVNITGIMNQTMGVKVAGVPADSDPTHGIFAFNITLKHPYPSKPQLAGFDVKGILITPGTLAVPPLIFANADETALLNANGFARWWNPSEFTSPGMFGYTQGSLAKTPASLLTATVNPYKLFADILGPTDDLSLVCSEPLAGAKGRAVFKAGGSNTREYKIKFPMSPGPVVKFGYAIDACWAAPSPNPPVNVPGDFPINANQPEAYRVEVTPTLNNLYYDDAAGVGGGVLRLQVNVSDWQGQQAGDVNSQVKVVRFFSPDLMSGYVDATFVSQVPKVATYTADLTGKAIPTHSGKVQLICRVGTNDGSKYKQTGDPAPDEEISAFQVVTLNIQSPTCVGDANNDWSEAENILFGTPVIDQVCLPDDYKDFYHLNIPVGSTPVGQIHLYCDAVPTKLGLYDSLYNLITESDVASGNASIQFAPLNLFPGDYFIRILTSNTTQVAPYVLELQGEMKNVTPSTPVDVTPPTLYVNPDRVWINGNYEYMDGSGFWVYDISDPSNPVQVVHKDWYYYDYACFHYPYIYLTDEIDFNEFQIDMIDVSNPTNPVLHENLIHYNEAIINVTMNSKYLFVGSQVQPTSTVYIYDYATNPLAPTQVGSVNVPYDPQIMNLLDPEGSDPHLIVGTWSSILSFDISNPASPTATGEYDFATGSPRDIVTNSPYIYVCYDKTSGGDGWLYAFSQTGINLVLEGTLDTPGAALSASLDWPYACICDGYSGLTMCDVSTAGSMTLLGTTALISGAHNIAVKDHNAYISLFDAGLEILNLTTPITPSPITHLHVVNSAYSMVQDNNYLIVDEVGSNFGAVKTVDISNPPNARVVGEYFAEDRPWQVSLDGNILAVRLQYKWILMNASDPKSLTPYYTGTELNQIKTIAVHGNVLYVVFANPTPSVSVYDITDPGNPSFKTSFTPNNIVGNVTFAPGYMYLVTGPGVEIYSLTNPLAPNYIGSYAHSTAGYEDAQVQGNYLYMATETTFEMASIGTPSTPAFTGSALLPGSDIYSMISVDGQFAYVAGYTMEPVSVQAWPPTAPAVVGPIDPANLYSTYDILAYNGFSIKAPTPWASEFTACIDIPLFLRTVPVMARSS